MEACGRSSKSAQSAVVDIPKDIPPSAIDRLRAAVDRALEAAGSPTPAELEEASIRRNLRKLDAQTITDFLDGKTIMGRDRFKVLITCLGTEEAENWRELHTLAERERNQNSRQKRRVARLGPERDSAIADASVSSELGVDESTVPPETTAVVRQTGPSEVGERLSPPHSDAAVMTAVLERVEPGRDDVPPEVGVPPAPLAAEPRLDRSRERRGRRKLAVVATVVAAALMAVVVVVVVVWLRKPGSTVGLKTAVPRTTAATEIRKGSETTTGTLSWAEAPINGSMVGQAKQMADTVGLWSQPSLSCDLIALSSCIPGSVQTAKVTLPATVRVTCVTTGQRIRNGAPGSSGYYEDDRWLMTAPNPTFEGTGYLSNVWFAREKLPTNLAKCSN